MALLKYASVVPFVEFLVLVILGAQHPGSTLTYTTRQVFSDWAAVLRPKNMSQHDALAAAWCTDPVPLNATRPPICSCIENGPVLACFALRPPYRLRPTFRVPLASPMLYLLAIVVAAGLATDHTMSPWISVVLPAAVAIAVFIWTGLLANLTLIVFLAIFAISTAAGLAPVLCDLAEKKQQDLADEVAFLWAEAWAAPVFALYFTVTNCSHDTFLLFATIVIAGAMSSMPFTSVLIWRQQIADARPEWTHVRLVCWLTSALCTAYFFVLYTAARTGAPPSAELASRSASWFAVLASAALALLHSPSSEPATLLPIQVSIALFRTVAFATFLTIDLVSFSD